MRFEYQQIKLTMLYKTTIELLGLDIFLFNNSVINHSLLHVFGKRCCFVLFMLLNCRNFWSLFQQTVIVQAHFIGKISSGTNQWDEKMTQKDGI